MIMLPIGNSYPGHGGRRPSIIWEMLGEGAKHHTDIARDLGVAAPQSILLIL